MGNTTTKISRRHSTSTGSTVRRVHWGSSAGLPAPPGKPILIPSVTEDSQPIIVGIRWERSSNNGGSAIIGYLVEHRRVGSPHWIKSSPGLCPFPELTLSGLEPGWRYQFRIRAQNAIGLSQSSELSEPLTVTLQRAAASAPCFILELADRIALENEQIEFLVHFTGTPIPKISWFKDGFEIFSSRRTKIITENGRSSLLIHQTALNDEGEIKCTATNKAGYASTRGKLILEALPRIRLPRQYEDGLLFEKGETIRLKISVAGRPSPHITWYHDGAIIIFDDRHMIESIDTGEYSIIILTAMRNDRGEYMIKAVNKLGEDNASFLVTVTDRPSSPGKVTIVMTLGRSVTLSWSEPDDDGGCKIGTYIIEYYRIGWDVWLKAGTSRQATTTLGDLIEDSEYKFRVKAENPYGVSDPSQESDVIFISNTATGSTSRSEQALDRLKNSQKQLENNRGRRLEKHDESIGKSTKRTRSLTRDEVAHHEHSREYYPDIHKMQSRAVSAQPLISNNQPIKPSRSDSRVTFANTVFLHGEQPLDDIEIPLAKPRSKHDKLSNNNNNNNNNNKHQQPNDTVTVETLNYSNINVPYNEDETTLRKRSVSPLPTIRLDQSNLTAKTDEIYIQDGGMQKEEYEDEKMNEEFMLVLYPENDEKYSGEKFTANDLRPPHRSLSLPELFSMNYDVIEVLRDAFSSTELLHELALERFYKALAMEEGNMMKSNISDFEKIKDGLDFFSTKLRSLHPQKTPSVLTPADQCGARRKWNRRSSEGYSGSLNPRILSDSLSLKSPQLVLSDSNLKDIQVEEEFRNKILQPVSTNSGSLHRWDDKSMPLIPVEEPSELSHNFGGAEDTEEDKESVTSEDLNIFKSKILGQLAIDDKDVDTREGESTSHELIVTSSLKPNVIQPKSILKKRTEEIFLPLNSFGRPIPPEKFIGDASKSIDSGIPSVQYDSSNLIGESDSLANSSEMAKINIMSDIESDNTNLMNAAEVAKNRRKSNGKYSLERKPSTDNEEDIEAQRAVISHYTEIMKEYSIIPSGNSALQSSTRFTRRNSFDEDHSHDISSIQASLSKNTDLSDEISEIRKKETNKVKKYSPPKSKSRDVSNERKVAASRTSKSEVERGNREKSTSRSSSKTRKRRESSVGRIIGRKNSDAQSDKIHSNTSITDSRNTMNFLESTILLPSNVIDRNPSWNNRIIDGKGNKFEEIFLVQTRIKVQSIMSYITDLTLFFAAVYVYFFKKEILAIPFIALVLFRRIQKHMINWMPHK